MRKRDDTRKTNSGAEWRAIVYMLFPRDGGWYACLPKDIRAPLVRVFNN